MPTAAADTVLNIDDDLSSGGGLDANTGSFAETSLDVADLAQIDESLAADHSSHEPKAASSEWSGAENYSDNLGDFAVGEPDAHAKPGFDKRVIVLAIAAIGVVGVLAFNYLPVGAGGAKIDPPAQTSKPKRQEALAVAPAQESVQPVAQGGVEPPPAPAQQDALEQLPAPTESALRAAPTVDSSAPTLQAATQLAQSTPGAAHSPAAAPAADSDFKSKYAALDQRLTAVESSVGALKTQVVELAANMDKFMSTMRARLAAKPDLPAGVAAATPAPSVARSSKKRSIQLDAPQDSATPAAHAKTAIRTDMILQAIVPGRAWLRNDSGDFVTVTVGDVIDGVGKVTEIDSQRLAVVTTGGTFVAD